jgi:hypothetical protein
MSLPRKMDLGKEEVLMHCAPFRASTFVTEKYNTKLLGLLTQLRQK